jgi:hypothetical protein
MNLILTMAGRYTRFIDEGYRIPKYLLPWGAGSILEEIVMQLKNCNSLSNIYLTANKRDEIYMPHVRRILKAMDIPIGNLFLIPDTSGQAETAFQSIINIQKTFGRISGPIIFHNIDTILYGRDLSRLGLDLEQSHGYIDIFRSSNHNYSYVLTQDGAVKSIAERVLISNNATSGLYAFSDAEKFLECYSGSELYISDLYTKMLGLGMKVKASRLHSEKDTVVLGTPSEYLTAAYILDL